MQETKLDIPLLQPGEKIVGLAYLTEDDGWVWSQGCLPWLLGLCSPERSLSRWD